MKRSQSIKKIQEREANYSFKPSTNERSAEILRQREYRLNNPGESFPGDGLSALKNIRKLRYRGLKKKPEPEVKKTPVKTPRMPKDMIMDMSEYAIKNRFNRSVSNIKDKSPIKRKYEVLEAEDARGVFGTPIERSQSRSRSRSKTSLRAQSRDISMVRSPSKEVLKHRQESLAAYSIPLKGKIEKRRHQTVKNLFYKDLH